MRVGCILIYNYRSQLLSLWGQFHQYSTSSFYARRSQKRKKDSQLKLLLALSGSLSVKAVSKHVDEIDPWSLVVRSIDRRLKRANHSQFLLNDAFTNNWWEKLISWGESTPTFKILLRKFGSVLTRGRNPLQGRQALTRVAKLWYWERKKPLFAKYNCVFKNDFLLKKH